MFVFENVVGIKSAKGGEYLREIQRESFEAGYKTEFRELNAFDFGVLQNRRRVIIKETEKY
jgi:DNA (cytosine-5)-methyltransferase 1